MWRRTPNNGFVEKGLHVLVIADFTRTKGPNTNIFYCIIIIIPSNEIDDTNARTHSISRSHSLFRLHTVFYRKTYWFYQRLIRLGRILGEILSLSHSLCPSFVRSLAHSLSVALSLSFGFQNWNNHYRIVCTRFVCIHTLCCNIFSGRTREFVCLNWPITLYAGLRCVCRCCCRL